VADIRNGLPKAPPDVILANAVLQWVPDHETLLPALVAKLGPGGALAVQVPDNMDEPSHRLMREVAGHGPWAVKLMDAAARAPNGIPRAGISSCCAPTRLISMSGGRLTFIRWPARESHCRVAKGNGAFALSLIRSSRASGKLSLLAMRRRIANAYPAEADVTVLLPFPRLFLVAAR